LPLPACWRREENGNIQEVGDKQGKRRVYTTEERR